MATSTAQATIVLQAALWTVWAMQAAVDRSCPARVRRPNGQTPTVRQHRDPECYWHPANQHGSIAAHPLGWRSRGHDSEPRRSGQLPHRLYLKIRRNEEYTGTNDSITLDLNGAETVDGQLTRTLNGATNPFTFW